VGAEAGLRRALERWFAPAARKLGWRTEFSWERYAEWAKRCRGMRLVERRAMPPFGHFSLIRFSQARRPSAPGPDTPAAHPRRRPPPPGADRPQFTPRNSPSPPIDARLSHRIHRIAIASTHDDNTESCYAAVSRGPESAALGRSSLLSSQPGQSIASFGERDQ